MFRAGFPIPEAGALLVTLACICLLCPSPCTAGGPSAAQAEQAAELFDQGLDLYEHDKYAQALVKFLDSWDLNQQGEILYNIAVCYEHLDQQAKAIEYQEKYLATIPEDDEKERAKVMAKIEALKGGEVEEADGDLEGGDWKEDGPGAAEEDDDDDAAGSGGEKKKKKKFWTGNLVADWMHGLWFAVAYDMDFTDPAYPDSRRTGLGLRGGYMLRLLERKLVLGLDIGYLSIGTWDQHSHAVAVDLNAGYRVVNWAGGKVQLVIGGLLDFKWYRLKITVNQFYGSIGIGAGARLIWSWSDHAGLIVSVAGVLGLVPRWKQPAHGYLVLQVGLVFGIK